jgi:hypothetical protein
LINQCCQLERSVKRSGRDEISHPTHGHDDLINSVAGVAAVISRRALHKQVPIVGFYAWSKTSGEIATPIPSTKAALTPRQIAQSPTPTPPGFQRTHEPWRDFVGPDSVYSHWPGSGPREW